MALVHSLYAPGELARQIAGNARALRLARNLSRRSLAEHSGVPEPTIKRFETTGRISLESLLLLAGALGVAGQLAGLFQVEQPASLDELRRDTRQRGRQ